MNVWKIGTRWGAESVLDKFIDYGILFFGNDDDKKMGDCQNVREGDLFVITEGKTPVAIAKALSRFQPYSTSDIIFRYADENDFIYSDTMICRAQIRLLTEKVSWRIDPRKRFCGAPLAKKGVENYWEALIEQDITGKFDITSRTVSLLQYDKKEGLFSRFKTS
ncbi:MAG: hypothetical protein WC959_08730 [Kiritimatiellales bacterium]